MAGPLAPFLIPNWTDYARSAQESAFPDLWDGRVGDWVPALGKSGEKLFDISGHENHGTLTNMDVDGDWVFDEVMGGGIDFIPGSNDHVLCGSAAHLDDLPALSVVIWVYVRANLDNRTFIGKSNTGSDNGWKLRSSGTAGQWRLSVDCDGTDLTITFSDAIVINEWTCLAATYPGGLTATNVKGYRNGVESAVATSTNGTTARTTDAARSLTIGNIASGTSTSPDAIIGRAMLYNRVLSQGEIRQFFDNAYIDLIPLVNIQGKAPAAPGGAAGNIFASNIFRSPIFGGRVAA